MKMFNVRLDGDELRQLLSCVPSITGDQITPVEISTTDPKHPANKSWVMTDPHVEPAPTNGESLLVIQQGGVLIQSQWAPDYWAWAYKPSIPQSVKDRMYGRKA